jgi:hypothetical protein
MAVQLSPGGSPTKQLVSLIGRLSVSTATALHNLGKASQVFVLLCFRGCCALFVPCRRALLLVSGGTASAASSVAGN